MKNKQNIVFILIILVIALLFFVYGMFKPSGSTAIVSISDGETTEINLTKSKIYNIEGAKYPVTLEVANGKIRFINSLCPDHVCEGFGWIFKEEDTAICAPARVVVSINP